MRILIYGSTYLTAKCCRAILDAGDDILVGYIPNKNPPTVQGQMELLLGDPSVRHDIALSIQFDDKITDDPAFNLHTGLLPDWGGTDILYHTIKQRTHQQGLTFHKITDKFDCGPIVAKMTYPVLPGDDILSLFQRQVAIAPAFVVSALKLVKLVGLDRVDDCFQAMPRLFKRGDIDPSDAAMYAWTRVKLRERYAR